MTEVEKGGQKWLITGANGNLGTRLILEVLNNTVDSVVAVVRSERARSIIDRLDLALDQRERLSVEVLDYGDETRMRAACEGCTRAVHLVGILKATKSATYEDAHENACQALVRALDGSSVEHVTYMSIVGSRADAGNACLASKGRAEDILLNGAVSACVLRVPMVLGEGDYASFALKQRAGKSTSVGFRLASLEQPIYAGDVIRAIRQAAQLGVTGALDLGGPEVLSREQLTERAARTLGRQVRQISLPFGVARLMGGILQTVSGNPPVTVAMLEVLDHDDEVDPEAALKTLQMEKLTPLDRTLQQVLTS